MRSRIDEKVKICMLESNTREKKDQSKPRTTLPTLILRNKLAADLIDESLTTISDADQALDEVDVAIDHLRMLRMRALRNKALVINRFCKEHFLTPEDYEPFKASEESSKPDHRPNLMKSYVVACVKKVRDIFFDTTRGKQFGDVICVEAEIYESRHRHSLEVSFVSNTEGNDDLVVVLSCPFGGSIEVSSQFIHGGVDVKITRANSHYDAVPIVENSYDIEEVRELLAKTIGSANTKALVDENLRKTKQAAWYTIGQFGRDMFTSDTDEFDCYGVKDRLFWTHEPFWRVAQEEPDRVFLADSIRAAIDG